MSKSVVMAVPPKVSLARIRGVFGEWGGGYKIFEDETEVQIQRGESYLTVRALLPSDDVLADYLDNEDLSDELKDSLKGKIFLHILFNDYDFCRDVIRRLLTRLPAEGLEAVMDNDYGKLIPGNVLLARLTDDAHWDWRTYEG